MLDKLPSTVLTQIQGLRFVAAAMVLLFHAGLHYAARDGTIDISPVKHVGYFGVDLFFVISGYIMWHTTSGKPEGSAAAIAFFIRRATRIYLGYLPVVLIVFVLLMAFDPGRLERVDWLASIALFPVQPAARAIDVSWTLTFEMAFYCMFGIAILSGFKRQALLLFAASIAITAALFTCLGQMPYELRYVADPMVLEFFMGIGVAILAQSSAAVKVNAALPIIFGSVVMLVTGYLNLRYFGMFGANSMDRVIAFGSAASLIVFGVALLERKAKAPAWMVALGDASYALYLLHMPVIYLLLYYLPGIGLLTIFAKMPALGFVAVVVASLIASVLYLHLVERPLLKLVRARLSRKREDASLRSTAPISS